jgi:hypothetical protein
MYQSRSPLGTRLAAAAIIGVELTLSTTMLVEPNR